MSNNLSVKITADVQDLVVKSSIAKAQVQGLSSEMNRLGRASAAGTIDQAGEQRMAQLAGDLLRAKTEAAGYASALEKAGFSTSGFGRATESMHGSISSATREFRALFDELSSGRTRYTPGTLAIIANKVFGLQASTLLAAGGVAALVAGLGYLVLRSIEAGNALDRVKVGADFVGNLDITKSAIEQFAESFRAAANVSQSQGAEIADSLARVPGMSVQAFKGIEGLVSSYAEATKQDADQAGQSLAKLFESKTSAADVAKQLGGMTEAQLEAAKGADASGNAYQVQAEKLALLESAITRSSASLIAANSKATSSFTNFFAAIGFQQQGLNASKELLADNTAQVNKNAAAVQAQIAALRSMPAPQNQTLQLGMETAEKENPISQQMEEARQKIQQMTAALAIAKQEGDSLDVSKLNAGLETAREKLAELVDEQYTKAHAGIEAQLQDQQKASEEAYEIAQTEFSQESELLKQQAAQEQQLARMSADTDIQISKMKIDAQKEAIEAEVAADKQGAAQRYAVLKQLTEQEAELDIQNLQNELSSLQAGTVAYQQVADQIREIKAREAVDIATIDKQIAQSGQKAAQEDTRSWKSGLNEIESAEGTLVSSILSRRESLSQSLIRMSSQLAEREITDDLKYLTTSLAAHMGFATQQQALDQQGTLLHGIMMLTQGSQTAASQQLQTVTVTASYIQQTAAAQASQTAQTAAVITGNAARTAATVSGQASAKAASAAVGAQTVLGDAAKAFSGTYASVAQIPYVGWILAPAAAAAAFAAVAAYQGMASLATGTMNVPQDMPAMLHQGEAVLPRAFAQDYREQNSGSDESEQGGGDTHNWNVGISAMDQQSFAGFVSNPGNRTALAGAVMQKFQRGWRPR